ncbi:MAG: hypothetical protein JJE04_27565 [Acidobacteriia bacterium]|nr:hypothetical protein [Terriglobia bacterium]
MLDKSNTLGPVSFKDASAFRIPAPGDNGFGGILFYGAGYWNIDFGGGSAILNLAWT